MGKVIPPAGSRSWFHLLIAVLVAITLMCAVFTVVILDDHARLAGSRPVTVTVDAAGDCEHVSGGWQCVVPYGSAGTGQQLVSATYASQPSAISVIYDPGDPALAADVTDYNGADGRLVGLVGLTAVLLAITVVCALGLPRVVPRLRRR